MIRSVKNRFGSTNEIGVFEMKDKGLVEVPNPSEFMLEGRPVESRARWCYAVWKEPGPCSWSFRRW